MRIKVEDRKLSETQHTTLSDSEVGAPLPIEAARCSAVPLTFWIFEPGHHQN